jgi:hypothetical protein
LTINRGIINFPNIIEKPVVSDEYDIIISEMEEKIRILENKIYSNQIQIEDLSVKFIELQNQNPQKNTSNVKILIAVFEMIEKINNNEDFTEKYEFLKTISSGNSEIYDIVVKIGNYIDYNPLDLDRIYYNEYNKFIKIDSKDNNNNKKSKIKQLINDNIIIRKIDNIESEKDSKTDVILYKLSNSIKNKRYEDGINIINDHNLNDNFVETKKFLIRGNELKILIRDILKTVNSGVKIEF